MEKLSYKQRKVKQQEKLRYDQAEMKAQVLARIENRSLRQPIVTPKKVRKARPVIDRFVEKISHITKRDCWIWGSSLYRDKKYGRFSNKKGFSPSAHRASWELFRGPIPQGLNVCHHCDTPLCVNPDHLFLGTDKDNMQDMIRKKRWNLPLRLTDDQVRAIRKDTRNYKQVAHDYNVTPNYINDLRSRRKRYHVV